MEFREIDLVNLLRKSVCPNTETMEPLQSIPISRLSKFGLVGF